jgi:hypothetical protein
MQDYDYGSSKKIENFFAAVPGADGSGFYPYSYANRVELDKWRLLPKY